jgi:agmatine deiminase
MASNMQNRRKQTKIDLNNNFRMPSEWTKHAATWLTWPHDEAHWPLKLDSVQKVWLRIIQNLCYENVNLIVQNSKTEKIVRKKLKKLKIKNNRLRFFKLKNNFSWIRDYGPMFVKNLSGEKKIINWQFNGWGNKWKHDLDNGINKKISKKMKIECINVDMILEGGSIDTNGHDMLLTTKSCLLNKNRNPYFSKSKIEQKLKQNLGIKKVIWLERGIVGDDTDGHIDDLARFVDRNTVMVATEKNILDENFQALRKNLKLLKMTQTNDGKKLKLIKLPMPAPFYIDGERMPATYLNFYIANKVVLMPIFQDKNDRKAISILQKFFRDRKVIGIDARDLIWGYGALHCITQQEPL